jgi:hypothetical protein
MKKTRLIILIVILVALVTIQFFQPEKNVAKAASTDDIFSQIETDQLVKKDIVDACYDCHSNHTRYPFYSKFAPISWMMNKHIVEGKKQLNFSEWGKYDKRTQLKLIDEICEVVITGEMPLKSYTFMHSSAILNEKEVEGICSWTDSAAEEIFSK